MVKIKAEKSCTMLQEAVSNTATQVEVMKHNNTMADLGEKIDNLNANEAF